VAESSWPNPATGRVVDDSGWEKLGIGMGAAAAVYGDFTSPQLIYGDSTGMQIKVAADRYAIVRGHIWWSGSSIVTKTIAGNTSGSTRVDLVVLRFSRTTWDVTIQIVQGTPGAGPPSSTKNLGTTGVYELVLAQVTVANNASTITAANVNYVGTHVGSDGNLQVADTASNSLTYVPQPYAGMRVSIAASGDVYTRNAANNGWLITSQTGITSYTPTFTTTGTQPVLGTGGVIEGEYSLFNGKFCNYRGTFKYGTSGATIGTSQFLVSLPFTAGAGLATLVSDVGACLARDNSGPGLYPGICYIAAGSTNMTFVAATGGLMTNNTPFAWAVSDGLSWEITYAIA
jgi:hypothetical protein